MEDNIDDQKRALYEKEYHINKLQRVLQIKEDNINEENTEEASEKVDDAINMVKESLTEMNEHIKEDLDDMSGHVKEDISDQIDKIGRFLIYKIKKNLDEVNDTVKDSK